MNSESDHFSGFTPETFFSKDSLFATAQQPGPGGVAGDPMPWTIKSDSIFTSMLLLCYVVYVVMIARAGRFIARQTKDIFFPMSQNLQTTETQSELRAQFLLVVITTLLISVAAYLYITDTSDKLFIISSDYGLLAVAAVSVVIFLLAKWAVQTMANLVFFDSRKNLQWLTSQLFITASVGLLIFPAVLLQVYFDLSTEKAMIFYAVVLMLSETVAFYKCKRIFFKEKNPYLQSFLYLCTLEITPLLTYCLTMRVVVKMLELNY